MDPVAIEESKPLVCRGCLAVERPLQPLGRALATLYDQLVSTAGSEADAYPQWVCSYCHALLLKFSKFRDKCRSSQDTFLCLHSMGMPITIDLLKSEDAGIPYLNLEHTPVVHINVESNDYKHRIHVPGNVKTEDGMDGNEQLTLVAAEVSEDGNDEKVGLQDPDLMSNRVDGNEKLSLVSTKAKENGDDNIVDIKVPDLMSDKMNGNQNLSFVSTEIEMPKELFEHSDYTDASVEDVYKTEPKFSCKEESYELIANDSDVVNEVEVETCNEIDNNEVYKNETFNDVAYTNEVYIKEVDSNKVDYCIKTDNFNINVPPPDCVTGFNSDIFHKDSKKRKKPFKNHLKAIAKEITTKPKIKKAQVSKKSALDHVKSFAEKKKKSTKKYKCNSPLANDCIDDDVDADFVTADDALDSDYRSDDYLNIYSASTSGQSEVTYINSYANYVNEILQKKIFATTASEPPENYAKFANITGRQNVITEPLNSYVNDTNKTALQMKSAVSLKSNANEVNYNKLKSVPTVPLKGYANDVNKPRQQHVTKIYLKSFANVVNNTGLQNVNLTTVPLENYGNDLSETTLQNVIAVPQKNYYTNDVKNRSALRSSLKTPLQNVFSVPLEGTANDVNKTALQNVTTVPIINYSNVNKRFALKNVTSVPLISYENDINNTALQSVTSLSLKKYRKEVNKRPSVQSVPLKIMKLAEAESPDMSLSSFIGLHLEKEKQCDSPKTPKTRKKRSDFRKNDTNSEGPYICEMCGRTKTTKLNLIKHMRTHTKPYLCSLCDHRFAVTSALKKHLIRTHDVHPPPPKGRPRGRPRLTTTQTEWRCQYCKKAFNFSGNRDRHEAQVHRSQRPCPCRICGRCFSDKSSLQMHINTKHLGLPWPKRTRKGTRQATTKTSETKKN